MATARLFVAFLICVAPAGAWAAETSPDDAAQKGLLPALARIQKNELGDLHRARAANFPATPNARRKWTAHADWIDGYLCDLPRGPAPSAGETQYVAKITPRLGNPKHSGTDIPWQDRYRVYCWIDANIPFYSHYKQMSPTILNENARKELRGVCTRRCAVCHDRRPRADAIAWLSPHSIWVHAAPSPEQWGITESGMRVRHLNLTHPPRSLALQAPLAKSADGPQLCVGKDGKPVFHDKNDADYATSLA